MTAQERRNKIKEIILAADKPISATVLANTTGVSRQVVVGDVALLRASGEDIISTARGYLAVAKPTGLIRTIACNHDSSETKNELYTIVDAGCTVLDVIVEHPIYGQITGNLALSSRYDVDQFIERISVPGAQPLSTLTEGFHLHTISCPDEKCFEHLIGQLKKANLIISDD